MSSYDPLNTDAEVELERIAEERAKRIAQLEASDFKWLMGNKRGRRFIWRLLERAGVFRSSFTGDSETFFKEGMRNIGLSVLAAIHEHSPEAYPLMLAEQRDYERSSSSD